MHATKAPLFKSPFYELVLYWSMKFHNAGLCAEWIHAHSQTGLCWQILFEQIWILKEDAYF